VSTEAHEGKRRGILVAALIDDVPTESIPLWFRRIQAANLVGWSGTVPHAGFEELVRAVKGILAPPGEASAVTAPKSVIQPPAPVEIVALKTRVNPKDGLAYVWIPPGRFTMGCSPGDEECSDREKPAHEVTITEGFWMGKTPVTQEAYERVMGKNPSYFKGPRLPVEQVTWDEAKAYCKAASVRLPSEAEWEYAARAGSAAARYGNLEEIAWYDGNSGGKTHEVGQKQANGFDLYDMLGNVWEWVADWYDEKYYGRSPATDPSGPVRGQIRVLRGGSWDFVPRGARAWYRNGTERSDRKSEFGFRCAGKLS
jgi:formylglycine-generating enzyme required for sulfatase activity